jgi:hypothetical protein
MFPTGVLARSSRLDVVVTLIHPAVAEEVSLPRVRAQCLEEIG